jgi:hypothetical protein
MQMTLQEKIDALPAGAVVPKTSVQVAVEYGINPDILLQWTDYLRRSRGAPASTLYAWHAFGTPAYDSLSEWTSPVARLFNGLKPSTRQELAAFYQTLFDRADGDVHAVERAARANATTIHLAIRHVAIKIRELWRLAGVRGMAEHRPNQHHQA